jgi:chromosomal replication initiator protein
MINLKDISRINYNDVKIEELVSVESTKNPDFWHQFIHLSRINMGDDEVDKWLINLEIHTISDSEITFLAPSKFIRDWVIREFLETRKKSHNLLLIAQKINNKIKKISVIYLAKKKSKISVKTDATNSDLQKKPDDNGVNNDKISSISKYGNVFAFASELNPRFTFANFITARYNKLAMSMAKIAAGFDNQPKLFDDNIPLFIHGKVGMGKTHLAQAIAWYIREQNSSKRVIYLSAEKFMFHFVQSVRSNELISFKEKMRLIDVLIVDDLQFIAGKQSTQQEFMNSFNSLVEDNKQVVLVCDRHPNDLENIDEKLKSRIGGGMVINFRTPDYQDRLAILIKKAEQLQIKIDHNILELLANNITTNIRDLETALKKLIAERFILNQEINLDLAHHILQDYCPKGTKLAQNPALATSCIIDKSQNIIAENHIFNIDNIRNVVARFYNVKNSDLSGNIRSKILTKPRQMAIYLTRRYSNLSLSDIGIAFNKHHSTIIYNYRTIESLIAKDCQLQKETNDLISLIKSQK